jgi:hypothetical protein
VVWATADIYAAVKDKLSTPPDDSRKREYPYELNAYIAGYWGYLELERLAGQPESPGVRDTLNHMLQFRVDNFSKDTPFPDGDAGGHSHPNRVNISRNFIYMTPELGQYLRARALTQVQEAVDEYETVAPYWFVSRYEGCLEECTIQNLHDTYALFQAKAWILQEPREELLKYLDVPAFMRGDLFYIHNLISAIEAQPVDSTPPSQVSGLTATAGTGSQIDLSWSAASHPEGGISGYNTYRDGVLIAAPTTANCSDTGLSP